MVGSSEAIDISDDDGVTVLSQSLDQSDEGPSKKKRRVETAAVQKVGWTDDSDDVGYEAFKKRKKYQTKPRKAEGKGKAVSRGYLANKGKKARHASSPDEDCAEKQLPEHLRKRREAFDKNKAMLKRGGLRLPPDYEGISFSDDETLENLDERPQFDEMSGIKPSREYKDVPLEHSAGFIPASIAQYLRDYQVEGVKFLHYLFVYQVGGILGDDMGLGKTVQIAAFLAAAFGKTGDRRDAKRMRKFRRNSERWYPRVLIICPGSLTQNWKNELSRWGYWNTDLYHSVGKEDVLDTARAGRLEIMITTYSTYKLNYDQINKTPWDVVVADECHCIKDPSTGVTRAMNEVNALCRIGLTGTAIQNKYEELWTLLNWTNPGKLGTLGEWKQFICKPLTVGQSHDATAQQLKVARETASKLVNHLLPQFFLRRAKSLISHQLPKKSDKVVFCPLTALQEEAYENFIQDPLVDFVKSAFVQCECGSDKKRGWCCHQTTTEGESWKSLVFPMVISLQKLSNHLTLLIPRTADTKEKLLKDLRYLKAAMPDKWQELYSNRDSLLNIANPEYCGKWAILKKLLRFWHGSGDKVLVFSHSVRLLKILQSLFHNTSYSVSYLDGSLSYEERQNTVDDFNSDPNQFVFLISTKAGGVGLNITSANKVIIMDPHWNPSYDLQAQDRAYRIGQVRDVEVYRLISAGTIEEITYARQIYKQQQANIGYTASKERRYFKGVQQDSDRKGEIFGIENLFSYRGDQVVLREIVNKTNIAEARVGVNLVDIDMEKALEDDDDTQLFKKEEADDAGGLGSLAAYLTKDEKERLELKSAQKSKTDPIHGILASVGVEYTHENSEVVGSSKVEEQLSRRAQLEGSQDLNPTGRALFFDSQENADGMGDRDSLIYRYNPPEYVMQRQFCTMAKTFNFPNATEFALVVEGLTQEQRRNMLDMFYKKRVERLKELGEVKSEGEEKLRVDMTDELKGETKIKDEDEKQHMMPTENVVENEIKDEVRATSFSSDMKINNEEPAIVIVNKPLGSIWLSDSEETDEL
ncbi:P-loop containing nucleoside triphosphate hydrolase protein [Pseudomassariella vexata]|uniref:p-loop containing nucleoside triphosphate hydrolase protein n=1 Tax=Pseudomassariella vexata TaxID=1141098 RepID=A0A1Y2EB41_9PEZI|nr:P-loop containing nucleoside triphosphate hydrolase protein [Pseudomassariella vexata]ORY68789.1 P-loop containing nucleoside triphosphate hydrolase protein [Pseudomassariella vexata]